MIALENYLKENYKTTGLKSTIKRYINYQNGKEKTAKLKDILDYIKENGCYYFFNEIPLDFLGLA